MSPARALYAFYFAVFTSTYVWSLLPRTLESLGWSGTAIGLLYGVRKVVDIPSTWVWGRLADRFDRRGLLRLQLALGLLAVMLLAGFSAHSALLTFAVLLYSATGNCIFPVIDSLTIASVGAASFGRVRAWGSAGYAVLALVAAALGYASGGDYEWLSSWTIPLLLGCSLLALLVSATLRSPRDKEKDLKDTPNERAQAPAPSAREFLAVARRPALMALLCLGAVHWAAQSPFNMLIVQLCEQKGFAPWAPGMAVFIGVSCEVALLAASTRLLAWLRPSSWMLIAIASGAARWALMSVTSHVGLMLALQALHALSFGAFFIAAVALTARLVPASHRASGQALLYLCVFGVGSIVGDGLTGYLFEAYNVRVTYELAAATELALLLPGALFARRVSAPRDPDAVSA